MPTAAVRRDPLADLQQRCRQLRVPLTPQRRAVYSALASRDDHPTAEQLFADLRALRPGLSKATAYRTLDKLVALGLVVRVSHPSAVARYDAKTWRHHHLVCDRCGSVADLETPAFDGLPLRGLRLRGFQARDFSVQLRGLCRSCARGRRRGALTPAGRRAPGPIASSRTKSRRHP